jgi:murein DD-endopeptidase MepM/ murein hydrolase activator NlpD
MSLTTLEAKYIRNRRLGRVLNPVPGHDVTTPYREKGTEWSLGYHTGEDHAAPVGSPVVAVTWGVVIGAGFGGAPHALGADYGDVVIIRKHTGDYEYFYAHLSRIMVRVGEHVKPGQVVGKVGFSGHVLPAGPAGAHCHFEVRPVNGMFGSDVSPILVKKAHNK